MNYRYLMDHELEKLVYLGDVKAMMEVANRGLECVTYYEMKQAADEARNDETARIRGIIRNSDDLCEDCRRDLLSKL